MDTKVTLVITDASAAAEDLAALLTAEGKRVTVLSPAQVLTAWNPATPVESVLVNSTLTVETVREVTEAIRGEGPPCAVVVFADGDVRSLEPHVLSGLDYIVPPFLPELVRRRLNTAHESAFPGEQEQALHKYERELQIGREIQAGFLPETLPTRAGWHLTVRFQPAHEVAGDFYDTLEFHDGERIGIVVADVCDKGVGAALFMALIRSLIRHTAVHVDAAGRDPGTPFSRIEDDTVPLRRAVAATNDYLTVNHLKQGYFATLFFAILDPATGNLVYINCGHNPPIIHRLEGEDSTLDPTGPALGLVPHSEFEVGRAHLDPGDILFAYTDGIPEARDSSGRFFSEEAMLALIEQATGADSMLDQIVQQVSEHIGTAEQFDDITMIALHRAPTGE